MIQGGKSDLFLSLIENRKTDRIINGDTIAEMKKLPSNHVDMVFADPPYYMRTEGTLIRNNGEKFDGCDDEWDKFESPDSYETFTFKWLQECERLMKPDASIWVIGSMQCIYTIGWAMQKTGYWFINDVIWHKTNPAPNFLGTRLNNSHETLIWAVKDKNARYTFNYKTAKEINRKSDSDIARQMGSVWNIPICSGGERLKDDEGKKLHSTQKPVELLERIIAISTKIDDVILDPFGGTMTTGVAAKKLGRRYILIERDKKYCTYGRRRLEEVEREDTKISLSYFDEESERISMKEMIKQGAFRPGEAFMLEDRIPCATLLDNGRLLYHGKDFDIHTCAAIAKNSRKERLNGFDFWYVVRKRGCVGIRDVRDAIRDGVILEFADTNVNPENNIEYKSEADVNPEENFLIEMQDEENDI